jgi:hypothetical protein
VGLVDPKYQDAACRLGGSVLPGSPADFEHLRRILSKYASSYNEVRTHLGKDAPCTRPIQRFGDIIAQPILGGLHHRYARI